MRGGGRGGGGGGGGQDRQTLRHQRQSEGIAGGGRGLTGSWNDALPKPVWRGPRDAGMISAAAAAHAVTRWVQGQGSARLVSHVPRNVRSRSTWGQELLPPQNLPSLPQDMLSSSSVLRRLARTASPLRGFATTARRAEINKGPPPPRPHTPHTPANAP